MKVTLRNVAYPLIWAHFKYFNVSHYCGAPTVQIGIVNTSAAEQLARPVLAIIAGSAPTAFLINELAKLNIETVHVYGLTYVFLLVFSNLR
jgi:hypothetical protein